MSALRIAGLVLAALALALVGIAFVVLRDSPARGAIGDRNRAVSGDAEIHYFTAGSADALRVVLLPSYGRSVSDFNELAQTLNAAGYGTIAVQPRGIDGSTLPSLQISLHTFAADVVAVLDAEGVGRPVIAIGHAYGNRIVRTLATDHPERIAALVLLAAGGGKPTPPETTSAITTALFRGRSTEVRRAAIEQAFFAHGNPVPEHWMRGWHPWAGLAQARATAQTPFEEWGAGGSAPILVLEPAEDAAAAGGGSALKQRFPDRVEWVHVEGAGHALLPERPAEVARAVLSYLDSL